MALKWDVNGMTYLSVCLLILPGVLLAQKQEIGLTLGGLTSNDRPGITLNRGLALQANYGYRLLGGHIAALYGEVHFLASPQRTTSSIASASTKDVASLYVTPGVRIKLLPNARFSPYGAIGGGWALYEQSALRQDGLANNAPRTVSHGAFDYGGGVDVRFWRFVGLRGEVRDFYTGSPAYNLSTSLGGQHNVVVGGGIVLRFQ